MNALLLISVLFSGYALVGQASSDTLQISKDFKTILIFPENISESSIGNDFGFIVDLPKPEGGKFSGRIIKLYYDELAIEKENVTNYLVITDTGNVYDFVLELVAVPKKTTWYITQEMAVANIEGKPIEKRNVNQRQIATPEKLNNEMEKMDTISHINNSNKIVAGNSKDSATKELYLSDPLEYYRLRCYYMQFDKPKISRYFSRLDNVSI